MQTSKLLNSFNSIKDYLYRKVLETVNCKVSFNSIKDYLTERVELRKFFRDIFQFHQGLSAYYRKFNSYFYHFLSIPSRIISKTKAIIGAGLGIALSIPSRIIISQQSAYVITFYLYFQFHQGLSVDKEKETSIQSQEAFNSIKDYRKL